MSESDPLHPITHFSRTLRGARGAKQVSPATFTRWIITGCPARDGTRVRLAATRVGGRWMIRQSDLDAFFSRLAADPPTNPTPEVARTSGARERAIAHAEAKLAAAGA